MTHIARITIAVDHIEPMVAFYNAVFGCGLEPFEMAGFTLYEGTLAGIPLVFTPNASLGIEAKQNRQQFDIAVPDADAAIEAALAHGGTLLRQSGVIGAGGSRMVSLADPDGNTVVIVETYNTQ
ncbi:MAG: VOC family protein [Chloroflexi bacterium]|nr:VOC family protein [Chloroflexota bacterium]